MSTYDDDFYLWSTQQADLLKSKKFDELDLENLLEEVESMGRSELRSLSSHLTKLLMHALKWQLQNKLDKNGQHSTSEWRTSWQVSIAKQRPQINRLLKNNPSLRSKLNDIFIDSYEQAREEASAEMLCPIDEFPSPVQWSFKQVMEINWLP